MKKTFDPGLYLVFDFETLKSLSEKSQPVDFQEFCKDKLTDCLQGGVTLLQFRYKNASTPDFLNWVKALSALARMRGIPFVINDSIEVASQSLADGVHLGMGDASVESARQVLGAEALVGLTVEELSELEFHRDSAVDYFAVSSVFPTQTKADIKKVWLLPGLRKARALTQKPLVAIGGINLDNADAVVQAGADGLAVVSALLCSDSPQLQAARLREILNKNRQILNARAVLCHGWKHSPTDSPESRQEPNLGKDVSPRLRRRRPRALSIAGSDSGGGAGLQADLKSFAALGVYGTTAVTALTAQNTLGVQMIRNVDPEFLRTQLRSILSDIGADAIKIGMLHRTELIQVVRDELKLYPSIPVVLDPVMIAKGGQILLQSDAITALLSGLFPRASLITPNLPEAEALLREAGIRSVAGIRLSGSLSNASRPELVQAARALLEMGSEAVLLKGGHHDSNFAADLLVQRRTPDVHWFESPRTATENRHGTGCTLSSAITAGLALGLPLIPAIQRGKDYVTAAIQSGANYKIGQGHGPVDHSVCGPSWTGSVSLEG